MQPPSSAAVSTRTIPGVEDSFFEKERAARSMAATPDFMSEELVINPEHVLSRFEYPVFNAAAAALEAGRGTYFVATFRHPVSKAAAYVEVAPFFARVIELLAEMPRRGAEALAQAASELGLTAPPDSAAAADSASNAAAQARAAAKVRGSRRTRYSAASSLN